MDGMMIALKRYGLLVCLLFATLGAWSQLISNAFYTVKPFGPAAFVVTQKASGLQRTVRASLQLIYTPEKPELLPAAMDGQPGVITWKDHPDIISLGKLDLLARSSSIRGDQIQFSFPDQPTAQVSLTVKFVKDQQAPVFEMKLLAHQPGSFSLGFTGMPVVDSADLDFVYQPLTWSWKRFPSRFALTEEAYANTAAVFTNHHHYTEGLAVNPSDIPYRYALAAQWNHAGKPDNKFWSSFPANGPKANSLFGLAIRNPQGQAQPLIYAPLPGTQQAAMKAGDQFHISLVYLLQAGDWQQGTHYLLSSVFHYRSERENATVSLNQIFENMLSFAMNDVYSGWNAELKASNYQFDVPGSVKNVSALHPLSIAMITGSRDILKRRAIPMIEYVMSREKFLFSTHDSTPQAQAPSHLLDGPCVDIGELAGLNELTEGYTPAFVEEASRLFGKSRQLNMNTETGGGTWQDYLARYRLLHNPADLQQATAGARAYLQQVDQHYSRNFFDTPGLRDKGAGFTTDYGYRIYDLFELYEETKQDEFLRGAVTGAHQFLLWTRSVPIPPAGNVQVNEGGRVPGIFPGRRVSALEGSGFVPMDEVSNVPESEIPAWRTSLNGLVPEAPNTYAFGPVMLTEHAPWLLRLAAYAHDTLLRDAAYNAVLGRYANFPGYYFTSLNTDVYQRADYPMHPFYDVKYNAVFYNHVWPHLAMLMDFLVSDFYYRSKGRINFPGTYAPGYAFLTSQVYGARKGSVMGHDSVQLWMPPQALRSDGIALNYLMGYDKQDIFIAFANTSKRPVTEHIQLNQELLPFATGRSYDLVLYDAESKGRAMKTKDGKLTISLNAGGLSCVQIKGLAVSQGTAVNLPPTENRFLRMKAASDSNVQATAMIIQPNSRDAVFYVYANQTERSWSSCTLRYRLGYDTTWRTIADLSYPFEFDIHLPTTHTRVEFELTGLRLDGLPVPFGLQRMNTGSLTILGLGDSITEGGPEFFSYLFPLDSMLRAGGCQARFIGPRRSLLHGDSLSHSGFSGRTAEFLSQHIDSIYHIYPADIVLLHSGHNHFVEEKPVDGIIRSQRAIIQHIRSQNPQAVILVAGVITSGKLPKYEYIPELNTRIRQMVNDFNDPHVVFVNQSAGWNWEQYTISDKVHPNPAGARHIAAGWYNALQKILNRRP